MLQLRGLGIHLLRQPDDLLRERSWHASMERYQDFGRRLGVDLRQVIKFQSNWLSTYLIRCLLKDNVQVRRRYHTHNNHDILSSAS